MGANTFGNEFALTTFGESHGRAVGGIIDGCPAGLVIDMGFVKSEMARRKTQNKYGTQRIEDDEVVFLSGLEENITLGTPIGFLIENKDIRKDDYADLKTPRLNHADYSYFLKYGINASSGGGRASARETAARVVGGSVAKIFLRQFGITIHANIATIGGIDYRQSKQEAEQLLEEIRQTGDSIGGRVSCRIENCIGGLGEPVFDKFSAILAHAMLSIPSAKLFEMGQSNVSYIKGSELKPQGIQGGISTGDLIEFSVGFKPVSSVRCKGRHDVCQLFRVLVIVEAMAALATADLIKRNQINTNLNATLL
ncbi:MAG: chorismate synthase [Bacteroidales bacterium]|jgi:chorismate synthase|nr:chorismate synthase [Bacteroidales bacterium]